MKKDLVALQGTWHVTSLEVDGQEMSADALTDARIVVENDRFTSLGMGAPYEGTLTVNGGKKPKAIDMKFSAGPEKGNTNLGIFELHEGGWRLCLNIHGKDRPKEFATRPNSGLALETLRRAETAVPKPPAKSKVKKTSAAEAVSELRLEPAPELEGEWEMVSCVSSGKALEAQWVKFGKRGARKNEVTVTMAGQVQLQARFTVDRAKTPKSMDYLLRNGRLQHGIYELNGETLKVNFSPPGAERPNNFKSAPGDGRTLTVWRLVKQ